MKKLLTLFSACLIAITSVQAQCDLDFSFANTGTNMTAFFTPPAASAIYAELGDGTLGAFFINTDGEYVCGTSVAFTGSQVQLAVMADDSTTPEKDGFSSGESINWFYQTTDGVYSVSVSPDDIFAINAISFISSASVEVVDCGGGTPTDECPPLDFEVVNTGSNMTLFVTNGSLLSVLGNGTVGVYFTDDNGAQVCGTMNILTKGIDNKEGLKFSQNFGSNGYLKSTVGYNSGKLKNGWGYSLAASYKKSNGWVDKTWSEGVFYYLKIQKKINDHNLSFTAFGAPQSHGQRSYKKAISLYDKDYAANLGIDTAGVEGDYGLRYNEHWGELNRYTVNFDDNGNPIDTLYAEKEIINSKMNYYHKPQLSFNHLWAASNKFVVSNILYASLGNGGGTGVTPSIVSSGYDDNRQINFQSIYDNNSGNTRHPFLGDISIDPNYSTTEHKSSQFLRSSINNHRWFGLLSTYNYQHNNDYTFSGGIDLRHYTGEHYREVYDLLGGDYYVANENVAASDSSAVIREGDKFSYHNDGLVKWAGLFQQMEYKTGNWSAFVNISLSSTGYKRIDYFKPLDLVLEDTTFVQALSYGDTLIHNGNQYTVNSNETRNTQSDWKWIPGYTFKTGVNYNIDEYNNVFMNLGYLEKAPKFNNIFDYDNQLYANIRNEKVAAVELGHSYNSSLFSTNLNLYHTEWYNKPQSGSTVVDGEPINYNINGIDALHRGIEFDVSIKISEKITFESLSSFGDWKWSSGDTIRSYDDNNQLIGLDYFDASGVHVGDAAQLQFGSSLRYSPIKNGYIKIKVMHYSNHYADFNPFDLHGENVGRDSWKIPSYNMFDIHAGYKYRYEKVIFDFKINILNAANTTYISDALNNDTYISGNQFNFDAASASVFFGMGRRLTSSLKLSF